MIEDCCHQDEREKNPFLMPLQCLKCSRRKGLEYRFNVFDDRDREISLILLGFEIALFKMLGIKEYAPLTDKQKRYLQGVEIEMLCAVDRGLTLSSFAKIYEFLTKAMEEGLLDDF